MLMALVFLPTLGSKIGFKPKRNINSNAALLSAAEGDPSKVRGFTGVYVKFIRLIIRYPFMVLFALGFVGFLIMGTFQAKMEGPPPKPVAFFTQTPGEEVFIFARTRGNSTAAQSVEIAKILELSLIHI